MKWVLLDGGLPLATAALLREAGWDAVHVREIYLDEAADENILARAKAESRVLIALGRDFPEMLALTAAAPVSALSIRRQGLRAADYVRIIDGIWREHEAALELGCAITVGSRLLKRTLPLR